MDTAEIIQGAGPDWTGYGRGAHMVGVQITTLGQTRQRFGMLFADGGEDRSAVVAKLRALADAVETGVGGVTGDEMLAGREINAAAFPVLSRGYGLWRDAEKVAP